MACYAAIMAAYIPPDWPTGVHPPGTEDFETTAVDWLLGVVPPDFRLHGVLRRPPGQAGARRVDPAARGRRRARRLPHRGPPAGRQRAGGRPRRARAARGD